MLIFLFVIMSPFHLHDCELQEIEHVQAYKQENHKKPWQYEEYAKLNARLTNTT